MLPDLPVPMKSRSLHSLKKSANLELSLPNVTTNSINSDLKSNNSTSALVNLLSSNKKFLVYKKLFLRPTEKTKNLSLVSVKWKWSSSNSNRENKELRILKMKMLNSVEDSKKLLAKPTKKELRNPREITDLTKNLLNSEPSSPKLLTATKSLSSKIPVWVNNSRSLLRITKSSVKLSFNLNRALLLSSNSNSRFNNTKEPLLNLDRELKNSLFNSMKPMKTESRNPDRTKISKVSWDWSNNMKKRSPSSSNRMKPSNSRSDNWKANLFNSNNTLLLLNRTNNSSLELDH